jgi:hypothetical protein
VRQGIGYLIAATVFLIVAAEVLPRLIVPAAVIFGMVVIGRLVWFHTQRW